jgi:hypothetical protein
VVQAVTANFGLTAGALGAGPVTLRFALSRPAVAQIDLFDIAGRRVRRLLAEPRGAGAQSMIWDGRSDGGAAVACGVYVARLTADRRSATARVIIVR